MIYLVALVLINLDCYGEIATEINLDLELYFENLTSY